VILLKNKRLSLEAKRVKVGYLFTLPFIIGAAVAIVYPIIVSVIYSFADITANASGYNIKFVGLGNYNNIFNIDPTFKRILLNTLKSTALNVPVVIIFSFFLASVLNTEFKGRGMARTVLFLPMILNSNLVKSILSGDAVMGSVTEKSSADTAQISGAFEGFLSKLDIGTGVTDLLVSSVDNITNILAMSVIPIIIMLAGLQSVSKSVYEASYVEGATKWEVFWKISLPIVSPMILVSVIYCIIDSFTSVDNAVIEKVKAVSFTDLEFGLGSAMAWSYLLIVLAIVALVYLAVNRFVSYSD
jgi:ABC-type sugar transport system permease subunit